MGSFERTPHFLYNFLKIIDLIVWKFKIKYYLCTIRFKQRTYLTGSEFYCFTFYLYMMDMNITLSTPTFKTYKLMYFFGAWITKEVIAAENDAEAVYDADATFAESGLSAWGKGVALFCGNRKVKQYC